MGNMKKQGEIKRLAWVLFCVVAMGCGVVWIFHLPPMITNDFWRGVFYPFAVFFGVGHFLMAGTCFWYSVVKRDVKWQLEKGFGKG